MSEYLTVEQIYYSLKRTEINFTFRIPRRSPVIFQVITETLRVFKLYLRRKLDDIQLPNLLSIYVLKQRFSKFALLPPGGR